MISSANPARFADEKWKTITFGIDHVNTQKVEISNCGRVRSSTNSPKPRILNGSLQGGYRIIRLKLFKERDKRTQKRIDNYRDEIAALKKKQTEYSRQLKISVSKALVLEALEHKKVLDALKKKYEKELRASELKRTVNIGMLVHRLVAEYFLKKPSEEHQFVIHLDFDKLNNHHTNLKWATQEDSTVHQQKSPAVIASKRMRVGKRPEKSKIYKLTTTRVMLVKKRIAEGIPLRILSKQFKVTETQLLRIKRGENWKDIPAAH